MFLSAPIDMISSGFPINFNKYDDNKRHVKRYDLKQCVLFIQVEYRNE